MSFTRRSWKMVVRAIFGAIVSQSVAWAELGTWYQGVMDGGVVFSIQLDDTPSVVYEKWGIETGLAPVDCNGRVVGDARLCFVELNEQGAATGRFVIDVDDRWSREPKFGSWEKSDLSDMRRFTLGVRPAPPRIRKIQRRLKWNGSWVIPSDIKEALCRTRSSCLVERVDTLLNDATGLYQVIGLRSPSEVEPEFRSDWIESWWIHRASNGQIQMRCLGPVRLDRDRQTKEDFLVRYYGDHSDDQAFTYSTKNAGLIEESFAQSVPAKSPYPPYYQGRWDWQTLQGSGVNLALSTSNVSDEEWEIGEESRAGLTIPEYVLPDNFIHGAWKTVALGRCGLAVGGRESPGFVLAGRRVEQEIVFQVVLAPPQEMFVDFAESSFFVDAQRADRSDRLEVQLGQNASWNLILADGSVHVDGSASRERPIVERTGKTVEGKPGVAFHVHFPKPFVWNKRGAVPRALTLTFHKTTNGMPTYSLSTAQPLRPGNRNMGFVFVVPKSEGEVTIQDDQLNVRVLAQGQ